MVGLFDSVPQAAEALDALLGAGLAEAALGVMMSDRAVERHFGPPEVRGDTGATSVLSGNAHRVAARLRPMAGLGTPGAGLVATGPLASALVSAGLGSRGGLEQALAELGAAADAPEVARRVKNGAVLISTPLEHAGTAQSEPMLQTRSSMFWRLRLGRPSAPPAVITSPGAPAPDRDARYRPAIESPDGAAGSRTGASRSGS